MQFQFDVPHWWASQGGPIADADRVPLPRSLRRRIDTETRDALEIAAGFSENAPVIVVASRHGELCRTNRMLQNIIEGSPPSPTDFSLAVHNALAGVLSITLANTAGHTAVSAGPDSFSAGLLETLSLLQSGSERDVLYFYYDEPLDEPQAELVEGAYGGFEAFAGLFSNHASYQATLSTQRPAQKEIGLHAASQFVQFLKNDSSQANIHGDRISWQFSHHA